MSLSNTPLSRRVFATTLLLTLGIGFALALVYMFARSVKPHREEGHGLIQGVALSYHGGKGQAPLLTSLQGSMGNFLDPDEHLAVDAWVGAGATEEGYRETIEPIFAASCVDCHDAEGYWPPLETYEEVAAMASTDSDANLVKLARMTHVHALGIPLLFYILGALFVRTRFPEKLKAVIVVVPFVGIVWDISHWWLTAGDPSKAVGIVIGGTLMSLGFAMMWFMTAFDVWMPVRGRVPGPVVSETAADPSEGPDGT